MQLIFIIIICNTCYYSLTWILLEIKCCSSFSQHTRGRKKVMKNRSACYRQNRILETSLNRHKQQVNMYRKRLTRLRKKITPTNGDTPRSKSRKLLRRQHVNLDVRRTLNYHHALVQSLKTTFRNFMKEKERSIVSHVVLSGITKRYRKIAEASLGFSIRRWKTAKRFAEAGMSCKQRVASKMAEALKSEVKKFYIRDYVSRSTTGKKETRTMLKEKKQKRFLTDTMQTLHAIRNSMAPSRTVCVAD